MIKLLLND